MNNAFAFLKRLLLRDNCGSRGVFWGILCKIGLVFFVVMMFSNCFLGNNVNALKTCSGDTCYHVVITSSDGDYILGKDDMAGVLPGDGNIELSCYINVHYLDENNNWQIHQYDGFEYNEPNPSETFYSLVLKNDLAPNEDNVIYDSYADTDEELKLDANDISPYNIFITDSEYKVFVPVNGDKNAISSEGGLDPERGVARLILWRDGDGFLFSNNDYSLFESVMVSDEVVPSGSGKEFAIKKKEQKEKEEEEEGEEGAGEPSCESSGASTTLGWLVCPTLQWLSDSAVRVYDDYVAPSLRVEPQLFQTAPSEDAKSVTETAWETFRNIANSFFIVLFLVVIFSQLTGVGIDNYGIKKILPKTIVVAILVNLSFIICLICVDLSNILGNGFQSLFNGLSRNIGTTQIVPVENSETAATGKVDISDTASNESGGGGTILPVLILAGMFSIAVIANPAILLTLLIGAIGVMVSILFLFVLLAARKAIIIMLTLVSPIAFVCYMLPNTKKLYDKWFKLWQTMLLLYPICGLLVGGGNYASKIMLAVGAADNGGFFGLFTAMAVGVVPIFFIPSVLKSSFSALGKIGAKISGMGSVMAGSAKQRMTNSNLNQNAQKIGAQHRTKLRAGYSAKNGKLNWYGRAKGRLARTAPGRWFGLANVQADTVKKAEAIREENEEAEKILKGEMRVYDQDKHPEKYSSRDARIETAKAELKKNAGNTQEFESSLKALVESGTLRESDISKIMRDLINDGSLSKMEQNGSLRGMFERMNKDYGNGFLSTDYELSHFIKNGGTTNGGRLGAYGEYAKNVPIENELKPGDLSRLSSESMAGLAASGKLDAGMAERALANNQNMTVENKIMLNSLADGAADAEKISNGGGYRGFLEDARRIARYDWDAPGAGNFVNTRTMNGPISKNTAKDWRGVAPTKVQIV